MELAESSDAGAVPRPWTTAELIGFGFHSLLVPTAEEKQNITKTVQVKSYHKLLSIVEHIKSSSVIFFEKTCVPSYQLRNYVFYVDSCYD